MTENRDNIYSKLSNGRVYSFLESHIFFYYNKHSFRKLKLYENISAMIKFCFSFCSYYFDSKCYQISLVQF